MRRIVVLAVGFGALLYAVHRLAMVAVAWLIGYAVVFRGALRWAWDRARTSAQVAGRAP